MTNKAKILFAEYTSQFIRPEMQRFADMWKIRTVESFLESGFSMTKKGIRDFIATLPVTSVPSLAEKETVLINFLSTRSKKQAKDRQIANSLKSGLTEDHENILKRFGNWLSGEKEFSPNTVRSYIASAKDYFMYYSTLTQKDALAYKTALLSDGKARKTVNIRLSALSSLGLFLGIPLTLKRLKVPRAMECNNVPSEEEMGVFLLKCREINQYWYLVSRCLATTGLRVHELLRLTHKDIISGGTVLIGKGDKPRRVFFQKNFIEEFKEWFNLSGKLPEERFCAKTTRGVAQQLRCYASKAGLDLSKFHPHAFRHYFAKQYLKRNPTDIVGLQNLLGHSSIETTSIYLQRSYEEQLADFHKNVTW